MDEPRDTPHHQLSPQELSAIALGKGPAAPGFQELYLRARGRVSRRTFWLHGVLTLLLAGFAFNTVLDIANITGDNVDRLVNLLLVWPLLVISAKRIHDMGYSGWWVLLHFVPVAGSLVMIAVLGSVPGARGPNRFGPDPLEHVPRLNNGR